MGTKLTAALGALLWVVLFPLRLLGWIFAALFGRLSWNPPRWATMLHGCAASAGTWLRGNPQRVKRWAGGIVVAGALAAVGGYIWHTMPRPQLVAYEVTAPALTPYGDDNPKPAPLIVRFAGAAAPLAQADKAPVVPPVLVPPIEGRWQWAGDRVLSFEPKTDWPVGQGYEVRMERALLSDQLRVENYSFKFATAPFEVSVKGGEFYQDPVSPTHKKAIVSVAFSHPVAPEEFEKRISLRMEGQKEGVLGVGADSTPFTVSYDKKKLSAFVHSAPIAIPAKDSFVDLKLAAGVRAQKGGPGSAAELTQRVAVPGLFSLRMNGADMVLVNNERFEPEQVLNLEASAPVHEQEMRGKVSAWVLPEFNPETPADQRKRPYHWGDVRAIGEGLLKQSQALPLKAIPAEREHVALHSYKFEADVGRYLYLKVDKGLKSFGGYQMAETFDRIVRVKPFPKEVRILHSGSLLPLSGERKVPVLARDVPALHYEIGRVLPGQIQHLVSQSGGEFGKPSFNYNFGFDNLSERLTEVVTLPPLPPGKAQYTGLDLGRYLGTGEGRRGLFMVKVQPWDVANKRASGKADARLIVLTDLGLLVKQAVDGSQDVFVQSIAGGTPVAGATVQVIGRNGLPILSQDTDADGHVRFPALKDFTREQAPVLYLAKKGGDLSFLPRERGDRMLDLSRFDVGGVTSGAQPDKLQAYLFSDRGIYRPGEEFRIGMIVRAADWAQKLGGIPLEFTVTDARGLTVKRERVKLPDSGFIETAFATEDTSPTGAWTVNLHIVKDNHPGSLIGSTTVKVQDFQPDRMKMSARFSDEAVEGWVSPENLKARINLQNLFGTPAANRKVKAAVTLYPAYPSFPSYRDFSFYDPQRAKESFQDKLPDGATDDKGEAEFDLRLQRFARATYRVHFVAQGFEAEGGRGVAAERSVLVSSMPYLVGFKADGDLRYVNKGAARSVQLLAIDSKAKKIAADKLTLIHLERKYVSVLTKQESGVFKYESKRKETTLSEKPFAIPAAGLRLPLATEAPGDYALVIRDAQGQELNRIEYSVAGHGNLSRSLEKNAELQIQLAKTDVAPGQEIELQIRAPYTGTGLITIERDKVYAWRWFKATATNTVQKIKVPAGLEGNGYVSVSFVRDINSPEIFMSPLSHGVAPFSVSLEQRKNKIAIAAPELVKPGEVFRMKVKTAKPAKIVVFAVDEGILQVAGYKTPDPLGHFFQKRALEVRTAQILDLILPEFKRLVESAAPGGDAEGALGKHLNPFKRKRDKPVAWWSGIVDVGPGGKDLSYTVPDYFNGTLRVMAVAVSAEDIGVFEKKALVRGDFVLSPNVPTQVAPGDEFEVGVGVANNLPGSGKGAAVRLELKTSPHLQVLGESRQELKIDELREGAAVFRVRATDKLGSGRLEFSAAHGSKSTRLAVDTSVRPAVPYRVSLAFGNLKPGGSLDVPTPRAMHEEFRTLSAGVSLLPLVMGQGLVAYLDKNPYGCTEQLVSQALPAVVLQARPEFGTTRNVSEERLAKIVAILRGRQNQEGGFGLWAANQHVVPWVSAYAVHFLLEARDRGHAVPADMLRSADDWLQQYASGDGGGLAAERTRAYAIYLLARQGRAVGPLATALQQRLAAAQAKAWRQDIAAAYLAAAYQLMKQERLAEDLLRDMRPGAGALPWADYYDGLARDAQFIYLLSRHFPKELKRVDAAAIEALVGPIRENRYNTLSSAYTLLALDAYASATGDDSQGKFSLAEILADGSKRPLALTGGLMARAAFTAQAAKLQFGSASEHPAWTVVNQSGFDRALPAAEIKQGIEVFREYKDAAGKAVTGIKLGDEVEVHLRIRATGAGAVQDVAIVDLLPGGFEVVPERRDAPAPAAAGEEGGEGEGAADGEDKAAAWVSPVGSAKSTWHPDYADVREDRVVLYGAVENQAALFIYKIKATNAGSYTVPPTYAEGMYDRKVEARSLGGKIVVEKK